jgi:hypothetical protein
MTMTRTEKTTAQESLAPQADGYTVVEFASPKLIMMARADRGHTRMTPVEYATHRLGRGPARRPVEDIRQALAIIHRRQRVTAAKILAGRGRRRAAEERRVTGFKPGTKTPTSWTSYEVERATKRK